MSAIAKIESASRVIHVLSYPETRIEHSFADEILTYEMPPFLLATDEEMLAPGLDGKPIHLGTVALPANAYVSQAAVDLHRPAGFGGSIPGAADFFDGNFNRMFQVGAGSVMCLAADPYYSELLDLKLLADLRDVP